MTNVISNAASLHRREIDFMIDFIAENISQYITEGFLYTINPFSSTLFGFVRPLLVL